jgi:hypothetical protein
MKKLIQLHEFDPKIYPRLVWVSISTVNFSDRFDNVSEWSKYCNAVVDCVYDKIQKRGGILIRFANKAVMTTSVITHESIHAALNILDYCDIQTTVENQEPLSYLAGWIADCCEKVKLNKVSYETEKTIVQKEQQVSQQ